MEFRVVRNCSPDELSTVFPLDMSIAATVLEFVESICKQGKCAIINCTAVKANRCGMNSTVVPSKWIGIAMSLRSRLIWNQKYEILRECQRRGITEHSTQIQSVGEWAVQHMHLQKQSSKRTIQRVLEKEQHIIEQIE